MTKISNKIESKGPKEIPLSRLHGAEAALAASRMREAELRLAQAQQGLRDAYGAAQAASRAILEEMGLSPENIIDLDALTVLPPKGKNFVVPK